MIRIKQSKNADSRTMDKNVTIDEFKQDIYRHLIDVDEGLCFFADMLECKAINHDFTKMKYLDEYFELCKSDEEFFKSEWWNKHITEERHHPNYHYPDDINLIDVLEHIVDRVMVGKARFGEVKISDVQIPQNVLMKAFWNTFDLLMENVEVED